MKYLIPGNEEQERVELLLSLTRINSEPITSGLVDHLCRGMTIEDAAGVNQVPQGNLSRALAGLNSVAKTVERVKEIDWPKYQELRRNQLTDISS